MQGGGGGGGETRPRTNLQRMSLGKGVPYGNLLSCDDLLTPQAVAVPHVVSRAPGVRRVASIRETSQSTSTQAEGGASGRRGEAR